MSTRITVRRQYHRPYLYPKQERILFDRARHVWCEASTKSGKTHGCIVWLHEKAALEGGPGRNYWWVAPRHSQARIAMRRMIAAIPKGLCHPNWSEQTITLLNGAVVWFKSGERPDDLYGEDVYGAVLDEASRMRHAAYVAVRSTLTATQGPIRIIGNVKGRRNWFYRGCRKAQSGLPGHAWARINAEDAAEAGIFPWSEIDEARRDLPESEFRQLYLALPGEEGDSFFATDRIALVEDWPRLARCARGWDFATTDADQGGAKDPDWTAGVLLAHTPDLTVVRHVIRARKAPHGTLDMLEGCALADGPTVRLVVEEERGAAGKTMVESIRRHLRSLDGGRKVIGSPVSGDKPTRAHDYAVRVNRSQVALLVGPWNDDYLAELDEFPNPDVHDDQVDASAHAYNQLAGVKPGARFRSIPA